MYTSVYDGIEATALYRQTPGILVGLLFVIVGAALLLVGAGAVARGLKCHYCTAAGLASLAGAAFIRGGDSGHVVQRPVRDRRVRRLDRAARGGSTRSEARPHACVEPVASVHL